MSEGEKPTLISLSDGVFAVRFRYHMVTQTTLGMALPGAFTGEMARNRQSARFAAETQATAGTLRADSEQIRAAFPAEVALLERQVPRLGDYVIFKLEPARRT